MKVAALQLVNYPGKQQLSFTEAEKLIQKAAAQQAEIAFLPELSSCGYIPNRQIWQYGENENGLTAKWACKMALKYQLYIGAGYLETAEDEFFNTYLIATPEGKLAGKVRKRQVESYCFRPGDTTNIIETKLGRVAIGICADNHKAWFYQKLTGLDFDLLAMPHAWATPYQTATHISQADILEAQTQMTELGQIFADGFGVPVVFVNAVGALPPMIGILGKLTPPQNFRLQGNSAIFQPDKQPVSSKSEENCVLTLEVDTSDRKSTILKPKTYSGWLHKGSWLVRFMIIPIDIFVGRIYYKLLHGKYMG